MINIERLAWLLVSLATILQGRPFPIEKVWIEKSIESTHEAVQIEYTENGGEKRHLTFADTAYGPFFAPLAEMLVKYDCHPTVICESAGTQAEDAATMRDLYLQAVERMGTH